MEEFDFQARARGVRSLLLPLDKIQGEQQKRAYSGHEDRIIRIPNFSFEDRLPGMLAGSDAFIVDQGGVGTKLEFYYILQHLQLANKQPDVEGKWNPRDHLVEDKDRRFYIHESLYPGIIEGLEGMDQMGTLSKAELPEMIQYKSLTEIIPHLREDFIRRRELLLTA